MTNDHLNEWLHHLEINKNYSEHTFQSYGRDLKEYLKYCLLYTSPSPRDMRRSRMPSSA